MDKNQVNKPKQISEKEKYIVISLFALYVLFTSFLFNSYQEIGQGLSRIVVSPSILVSDYFSIGNIGASFFNAGALMLAMIVIAFVSKASMNGPVISAIITIGGFALFGKNLLNVWPIILGAFLHSRFQKQAFSRFILPAFFGTALAPLVSQVAFGFSDLPFATLVAIGAGLLAGFVLPPLANSFIRFHQGFNLYNIGFTAGVTGMIFMSWFRSLNLQNPPTLIVHQGSNTVLSLWLVVLFAFMIIFGLLKKVTLKQTLDLNKQSGRLVSDFVTTQGFYVSLLNMGVVGLLATAYVIIVNGQLNGATIGGIFTIVGFGAFGKHVRNITPLFIGVALASSFMIFEINTTPAVLAALFGTTLAPIAGTYGPFVGIIAGMFHMAVVFNVGFVHGGLNLYNNGFAGGFVAAFLVPIINFVLKKESE